MNSESTQPSFFNDVLSYLTRSNVALLLILFMVLAGICAVILGELTLDELVNLLSKPVGALVIGGGLATVSFARAKAGEPVLGVAALLVIAYAIVGLIQVFIGDLTFPGYLQVMDVPAAGLAIGKGIFANNGLPAASGLGSSG
jgi:peptidoglycan/LPS O-acetylase OafA/YrhL